MYYNNMCVALCVLISQLLLSGVDLKDSASKLCAIENVNSSCSKQIWGPNDTTSDCILWAPGNTVRPVPKKNTKNCYYDFLGTDTFTKSPELLGKVKLRTYIYSNPRALFAPYLAFNSTFSDIKWESLKIRYKQNGNSKQTDEKNEMSFCREFTISAGRSVPSTSELFYDCLWSLEEYQGVTYTFEYVAKKGSSLSSGRFLFYVPRIRSKDPVNIDTENSELFMYIDTSNVPLLKLHVQMEENNLNGENYLVQIHYNRSSSKNNVKDLQPTVVEDDALTYEYNTENIGGSYRFMVRTLSSKSNGRWTPTYVLQEDNSILLIAIVGLGAVILSVVFFIFFIWRLRAKAVKNEPPNMLIIYAATTTRHRLAAVELAKFLNNFCSINALIEDIGIPKSSSKDPFIWCNEAFNKSKFVMVLSSPFHKCNNYEGIYRKVDALGLRLMRENMSDRKSKINFFNALLPYCTSKDIPAEAKNLRRFTLMKDFNKMLGYIHFGSSSLFHEYCIEPLVYGCKRALKNNGQALLRAINAASIELAERDSVCNCRHAGHLPLIESQFDEVELNEESTEFVTLRSEEKKRIDEVYLMSGPIIQNLNLLGEDQVDENVTDVAVNPLNGFDINSLKL